MPKIENGVNAATMLGGLENAKKLKLAEINDACETAMQALTATYPDTERLTFDQQKAEALAYQADNNADCPMLRPLAEARGMSMDELCGRVLAKAAAFSAAVGRLMGERQRMEDALDACGNVAEVEAVSVAFSAFSA